VENFAELIFADHQFLFIFEEFILRIWTKSAKITSTKKVPHKFGCTKTRNEPK